MRRRLITALLACALLAAPATAIAQDTSIAVPGSTGTPAPTSTSAPPVTSTPAPGSTAAPSSTDAPASTATPGAAAPGDGGSSGWLLPAILGGVLLLVALLWGIARWWAWEPRWLLRSRHATAEAGWRTSAAWAEFRDWIRLGR